MNFNTQSEDIFQQLQAAERFRREGNPGRSRVCARLAAGYAVQKFLSEQGVPNIPKSTHQTMLAASRLTTLPDSLRGSLRNLTMRVNEDHQLPPGVDLIKEAARLIQGLEKLSSSMSDLNQSASHPPFVSQ